MNATFKPRLTSPLAERRSVLMVGDWKLSPATSGKATRATVRRFEIAMWEIFCRMRKMMGTA